MSNVFFTSRQLEYFIVVYRKLDFAAAAKAIPMTYQGLKKSVTNLESEFGVSLFAPKDDDRLEPTSYATILYDMALKWERDMQRFEEVIANERTESLISMNLCAAIGTIGFLGYDLVDDFSKEYPDMKLNIFEDSDYLVDDELLNKEFTLGLTVAPYNNHFVTKTLSSNGCSVWVNRSHPLAQKTHIALEDLNDEKLMIPNKHCKANSFLLNALRQRGVEPQSVKQCSDILWSYQYAKEGRGIGIGITGVGSLTSDESVINLPLKEGYVWTFGISYRQGHQLTKRERIVVDFFVNRASKLSQP